MRIKSTPAAVLIGVVAAATPSIPSSADSTKINKEAPMRRAVDVDLDEDSAVKIAEVVLIKTYGERVLAQRPWKVSREGEIFTIEGTLKMTPTTKGGVASISIRKTNAEVVAIIHGA